MDNPFDPGSPDGSNAKQTRSQSETASPETSTLGLGSLKLGSLGLGTLIALVVANMVGAGVFTSSGYSMGMLGNPHRVMLAWVFCGVWALCGAIGYGALVARLPISGGEYLFLSRLVHPSIGFLAGWISLVAGFTAPIAIAAKSAVAYGMPTLQEGIATSAAASCIIIVTAGLLWLGLSLGSSVQNIIVVLKVTLLCLLIGWAFAKTPSDAWVGGPLPGKSPDALPGSASDWAVLVASMSWIALSYTGFNAAIYVAGEVRDAKRLVPRAMILATLVVTLLYLSLNYIFVFAPNSESISNQQNVAAIAAATIGGETMELLVRIAVTLAMISSVFAMLIAGPRVYQQMARDRVMPAIFVGQTGAPRAALLAQVTLSILAVFAASLLELMQYLGLTLAACGGLTVLSLVWSHRKLPNATILRWWELLSVIVYLFITIAILAAAYSQQKPQFIAMLTTFAAGVIVYLMAQYASKPKHTISPD